MKFQPTTYALIALGSISLIGCGSSSSGGGSTPTPTPTPTPMVGASVCDETFVECNGSDAIISGTVTKDLTLSSDLNWFLDGFVFIGGGAVNIANEAQATAIRAAGVTLTVPAGTHVRAFDDGALIVTRGSQIMANGSAANPITFSSLDDNFDGAGEWGGVVIQGFGPQFGLGDTGVCHNNTATFCNVVGEGGAGFYGGNNPAENSGVFRYVRIAEGGLVSGPNSEVNGLTFQGVGHGTLVEYVQVHNNQDDAFEWFGGTVNGRYLVATGNDDDDTDFDQGWKGNLQYLLNIKSNGPAVNVGNDPRSIEANSSDAEFVPDTQGALANVTIVGGNVNNETGRSEPGMRLRGSVTVDIYNTAVTGFDVHCVRIDDSNTTGAGVDDFSVVGFTNVIGDCVGGFYRNARIADSEVGTVGAQTFSFDAAFAIVEPVGSLAAATAITAVDNGSGFAFDATDYIGAVEPGTSAANAWWAGWTIPGTVVVGAGQ